MTGRITDRSSSFLRSNEHLRTNPIQEEDDHDAHSLTNQSDIMTICDVHTITDHGINATPLGGGSIKRAGTRDEELDVEVQYDMESQHDIQTLNTDVVTLNDIHTLNSASARNFSSKSNNYTDHDHGDDTNTDIRTVDHENATIDTTDRHAAALGQPQYYQEQSQRTPSELQATNGSSGANGVFVLGQQGQQPPIPPALNTTPERSNKAGVAREGSNSNIGNPAASFWSRLSPTRRSRNTNFNSNVPLAALATMPTNEDDNYDRDGEVSSLPGMIVIGTVNGGGGGASNANNSDMPTYMATSDGGADKNSNSTDMPSVWKQKLCGVRADRLIVLMMCVLLLAVAVIVGAIIVSNTDNTSGSASNSAATGDGATVDRDGNLIALTRTPVALGPTTSTQAPSLSPVPRENDDTATPTVEPKGTPKGTPPPETEAPRDTEAPVEEEITEAPSEAPTTEEPTDAPTEAPTTEEPTDAPTEELTTEEPTESPVEAPPTTEACGDSLTGTFFVGPDDGVVDCAWLASLPPNQPQVLILCQPGSAAYRICPFTCGACDPTDDTPDDETTIPPIEDDATEAPAPEEPEADAPTSSPMEDGVDDEETQEPTPDNTEPVALESIILDAYPSADLNGGGSESDAYEWLLELYNAGDYSENDNLVQIWTLAVLAYATDVEDWSSNGGWLQDPDECSWSGITCDGSGRVRAIELPGNNLSGRLPQELELLADSLETLEVSDNGLSGDVLDWITRLTNLEVLKMDRNDFRGSVPSTIDRWQNMRIWWFERNLQIDGEFPDEVSDMENLEELVFYYTGISGPMPSGVCDIGSLEVLVLDCFRVESECWTRCLYRCGGDTGIDCNQDGAGDGPDGADGGPDDAEDADEADVGPDGADNN